MAVVVEEVALVDLVAVAEGGVTVAAVEAEVVLAEAEEVNVKNTISCVYISVVGGRGGGQRSGAIQEFAGTKMTFNDSD